MARIESKVLFITTSPRTPFRMIPEIELLNTHFSGQKWNKETQTAFMELLRDENFFFGEGANDPAFRARDRINRAPKALGFVLLSPEINLTKAGQELVTAKRKEEIFLRQLLKFQLPSPFHISTEKAASFYVKPYLEMFRLIRHFGSLSFDEVMIFGLQMVDYNLFDKVVEKIERFRIEKATTDLSYKAFRHNQLRAEFQVIYKDEIAEGKTKTRESRNRTLDKFLQIKASNMRDYTDALFRYLRATGLVNISHIGKSISIVPEKTAEVDYFLENINRKPCSVDDEKLYTDYLGNSAIPQLLTDNHLLLIEKISKEFPQIKIEKTATLQQLKEVFFDETKKRKNSILQEQVSANLKFDDFGNPMSTAQGNMADIVCDFGDFGLTVEVTMQMGQRQYETEGEPVTRHLAKWKKEKGKPSYCLFIAPEINEACIAHFYALHKMNISYYGGISTIVPLPLSIFQKMVEDSYKASYIPQPHHVKRFFERSNEIAATSSDEKIWYQEITNEALNWLG